MSTNVFLGTGRRKNSVARVRVASGAGKITINGTDLSELLRTEYWTNTVMAPLQTAAVTGQVDVVALVHGGGTSGQAGALAHAIARALQLMNPELRKQLKSAGLLRRDPRMKERKKPGQPGARKRFQFSKR